MHAEVAPRHPAQRDEGLGRAVAWAVGLHLLLAVLLIVSPLLTWDRDRLDAAGQGGGGDVPVLGFAAEKQIADAPADQERLVPVFAQGAQDSERCGWNVRVQSFKSA